MSDQRDFEDFFSSAVRKQDYSGRLNLANLNDPPREMFRELHQIVNDVLRQQQSCICVGDHCDQHPTLYFDFIDSRKEVNALATQADTPTGVLSIIGVTDIFFESMNDALTAVAFSEHFTEVVTDDKSDDAKRKMFTFLYLTAIQFTIGHEIGHHFHGHVAALFARRGGRKEIVASTSADQTLERQAEEIDADSYSVHMTLNNLWVPQRYQYAASLLGMRGETETAVNEAILECFLAAVMCFFHIVQQPFHLLTPYKASHPMELARLNKIVQEVQSWASNRAPSLARWPSRDRFAALGGTIRGILSKTSDGWDEQGRFLESPNGEDYLNRLHDAQGQLRTRMAAFRWRKDPRC